LILGYGRHGVCGKLVWNDDERHHNATHILFFFSIEDKKVKENLDSGVNQEPMLMIIWFTYDIYI